MRGWAKRRVAALAMLAAGCAPAAAETSWRRMEATPGFPGLRPLLQRQVDRFGRAGVNHLCAVVRREREAGDPPGRVDTALAYWRERRRIVAIGPTRERALDEGNLGPGSIDLDRDIVGEHGQTGLSPSAVTRAQADEILRRCAAQGTSLALVKRSARP